MSRGPQPDVTRSTGDHIIAAFLELYGAQPLDQLSVTQICKRAGIARSTFYRYHADLDSLLESAMRQNTPVRECHSIIDRVDTIALEHATDLIADFYDQRAEAVKALVLGSERARYLQIQSSTMVPLFRALISRALDLTPMQLDYVSEYVARAKASMIALWVDKGQVISLNQISLLTENLVEQDIWTAVAMQAPSYGGPQEKTSVERHRFDYPWR